MKTEAKGARRQPNNFVPRSRTPKVRRVPSATLALANNPLLGCAGV